MADIYENIYNALEVFGETMKANMNDALPESKDVEFGGQTLRQSFHFSVPRMGIPITFVFTMNDYWEYVDRGRLPGKFPPVDVIKQWIINKHLVMDNRSKQLVVRHGTAGKGLKVHFDKNESVLSTSKINSLAFLFGRKIARDGIPATPFFTNTVTADAINQLQRSLSEAFKADVIVQIVQLKKDIEKKYNI